MSDKCYYYLKRSQLFYLLLCLVMLTCSVPVTAASNAVKTMSFTVKTMSVPKGYRINLSSSINFKMQDGTFTTSIYDLPVSVYFSSNHTSVASVTNSGYLIAYQTGDVAITARTGKLKAVLTLHIVSPSAQTAGTLDSSILKRDKKLSYYKVNITDAIHDQSQIITGYRYYNKGSILSIRTGNTCEYIVKGNDKEVWDILQNYVVKKLPDHGSQLVRQGFAAYKSKQSYERILTCDTCFVTAFISNSCFVITATALKSYRPKEKPVIFVWNPDTYFKDMPILPDFGEKAI